jgi:quercetin dioxygenase-like cupin family protein
MKVFSLVGLFALFMSPLQAQEQKDVAITQLLSTTRTSSGQPISLPQKDAQIVASVYDVMPGATLPVHNHPYPRYGYVLAGILRVTNIDTGQTDTYKRGSFFLESVGEWHVGTSVGSEPLKLLVIDVVEQGQCNIVSP